MSRDDVLRALSASDFESLVGALETDQIDFKEQGYNLRGHAGRADLVADVASLANARGGLIVLGVRTTRDPSVAADRAMTLTPVKRSSIDAQAYEQIVRRHVQPLVTDFAVRFFPPDGDGQDRVFVALSVEAQPDHAKPFVVDLCIGLDGETVVKNAIGWPVRSGTATHWHPAARVQQLLAYGQQVSAESAPAQQNPDGSPELKEALRRLRAPDNWDGPILAIQALPDRGHEIDDFFGDFAAQAGRWRGLRASGFGLNFDYGLEPVPNALVSRAERPVVIVARTGVVTVATSARSDYFILSDAPDAIANPFALVEMTFETLRFVYDFVDRYVQPQGWLLRIAAENLDWFLGSLLIRSNRRVRRPYSDSLSAPLEDASFTRQLPGTGDAGRDAYRLLGEFYGSGYGLGREHVPFVEDDRVDPERIAGGRS